MLAFEVTLLTGRYVATEYNDRGRAEWPPHPARFFSALVATHWESEEPDPDEHQALEWLETLGEPELSCSKASIREVASHWVPVNDTNVIGNLTTYEEQLLGAEEALETAERESSTDSSAGAGQKAKKARREVDKCLSKWREAAKRGGGLPKKDTGAAIESALGLFAERRVKQARTFPSVTPDAPRFSFAWPSAQLDSVKRGILDRLAARMVRLGHSSSLVSVRVVDEPAAATLVPNVNGRLRLRWVSEGQLGYLEQAHELHKETLPRVMPATFSSYSIPSEPEEPLATSVFGEDWIILERERPPGGKERALWLPATSALGVASSVRSALLSYAKEPKDELLSGHALDGTPSSRPHLAVVPIPWVGNRRSDGGILGVALVFPRQATREQKRATLVALREWTRTAHDPSTSADSPLLPIRLGRSGVLHVATVEGSSRRKNLDPGVWCGPGSVWDSVTPVALDKNPGNLWSRDPQQSKKATGEAEASVRMACERIGLPAPVHIDILPAAPVDHCHKARQFPPFPGKKGRTQRVLTHVSLFFGQPVAGPVLLGAGRYYGLGLLRPRRLQGE